MSTYLGRRIGGLEGFGLKRGERRGGGIERGKEKRISWGKLVMYA